MVHGGEKTKGSGQETADVRQWTMDRILKTGHISDMGPGTQDSGQRTDHE